MQGVHAQMRNLGAKSYNNYIQTSRIVQGKNEFVVVTADEKAAILRAWNNSKFDLKNFYAQKLKEEKDKLKDKAKDKGKDREATSSGAASPSGPPRTGWLHTRHLSFGERKELHARKDVWNKAHIETTVPPRNQDSASPTRLNTYPPPLPQRPLTPTDPDAAELERAIRASIKETSRGDPEEDARVEEAIRMSLGHIQRSGYNISASTVQNPNTGGSNNNNRAEVDNYQITDEEYQALIETALHQSLLETSSRSHNANHTDSEDEELQKALEASRLDLSPPPEPKSLRVDIDHDVDLQRALEASRLDPSPSSHEARSSVPDAENDAENDADLQRAIEASKKEMTSEDEELRRAIEESRAMQNSKYA
jgi:hypothetical protein